MEKWKIRKNEQTAETFVLQCSENLHENDIAVLMGKTLLLSENSEI